MPPRATLPVADGGAVRRYLTRLARSHPRQLGTAAGLHVLAAAAGLGTPWLVGHLVQAVKDGTTMREVDRSALAIAGFLLAQTALSRFGILRSARLGEQVLAELREDFVGRVLDLPLSTMERAGTGDLLTRTSRDVNRLSYSVRSAVPETGIAVITIVLTVGAILIVSPVLALPWLLGVPSLLLGTRWYLRRAPTAYLRQGATYADITDGLSETVEGARTVEALRMGPARRARTDRDIAASFAAERRTLFLRTAWFPTTEIAYLLPVVTTLLAGGWLAIHDRVTLGQVTAATLYVQQLSGPLDRLLSWLDELQAGNASLARLLGIPQVPPDRTDTAAEPDGDQLTITDLSYAYQPGPEVLHGVNLTITGGERLAVVGPSGAGKSTLGRLIAGIDVPRTGTVAIGGVPLGALPADELRTHVALIPQENHVFLGTLRDNLTLARADASDHDVRAALAVVDALDWALALPHGLDTDVGTDHHPLTADRAQQLALARIVLADPRVLVLDEATALMDPATARRLERSLAAVLSGRTVIAIAHRLFSAYDADRVAVVDGGRITELGSHDELIAANGSYAALWAAWQDLA